MSCLHKVTAVSFIIFQVSIANSFSQTKITLQQAIDATMKNNLKLKQEMVNVNSDNLDVYQARMNVLPNLNLNLAESINFGRSLDYTTYSYVTQKTNLANGYLVANFTISQGLQKHNQILANQLSLQAGLSTVEKLKNDLKLQVVEDYLSILNGTDQLSTAKQQLQLANQQLKDATQNYNVGRKIGADISLAKSQAAKAELNITTIQNQLNNAILDISQLMGLPNASQISLSEPDNIDIAYQEKTATEVYDSAVQIFPEIKQADFARRYAEKQLSIAKGSLYPNLVMSGEVASNYSHIIGYNPSLFGGPQVNFLTQFKTNLYQYLSLNLSIPIFNNMNAQIGIKKAKLNLQSASINEATVKSNLFKVINQAIEDFNAANKTLTYTKQALSAATDTYTVIQKKYNIGQSTATELYQALSDMNQAQFDAIHAKYDFIFKTKIIDFYLGKSLID